VNYSDLFQQLLPEVILVVTALAVLGTALAIEGRGKPAPISLVSSITCLGLLLAGVSLILVPATGEAATPLIAIDPLARLFKGIVLSLGLLAVLLPPARDEIRQPGEFHALLLFAIAGLSLTVGTNHLLFLFVALELASLSLYLLAGFPRTARASEASLKYFLFGGVSAAFLLFGLSLIYGFSRAATLPEVATALAANPTSPLALAGLAMILAGLGFKLAAAPFHYWAPDVYQGAPATSVALVAAASKVVGLVVLVRFLLIGFHAAGGSASWGDIAQGWSVWLSILAAVSIVFGNLLALAQTSVRRLLAYSAVANSGYLLVGLCANGTAAAGAALFYVVVYGLATLGALAVTAAVERDRGDDSVDSFAGLVHRSPLQALALLVFMASLAGIPPLAGFVGKFALFSKALADTTAGTSSGIAWLVTLAAVMSAVSLYYYLKVLKQAFVHDGPDDAQPACNCPGHSLAIAIPAIALLILGLFPALLLEPVTTALLALFP
jgi:NADH-quinone oxidoreductase subunit N